MPAPLLVVEHEADAGLGRFLPWFRDAGLTVRTLRPDLGDELPTTVADACGLVVCGGSPAAWEDELAPWLPRTRALLREAVERQIPTLGLCLGAQLLAHSLPTGRVTRGTAGHEIGLTTIRPTAAAAHDPLFAHLPMSGLPAAQWHGDAIAALPAGAVLLATGLTYRHQAFRVGSRAWGTQFHPEVTVHDFATWCQAPVDGVDSAAASADVARADAQLDTAWRPLALAFAALCRSPT